jgi:hypothetical protein
VDKLKLVSSGLKKTKHEKILVVQETLSETDTLHHTTTCTQCDTKTDLISKTQEQQTN